MHHESINNNYVSNMHAKLLQEAQNHNKIAQSAGVICNPYAYMCITDETDTVTTNVHVATTNPMSEQNTK